jgi:hypothetical protein
LTEKRFTALVTENNWKKRFITFLPDQRKSAAATVSRIETAKVKKAFGPLGSSVPVLHQTSQVCNSQTKKIRLCHMQDGGTSGGSITVPLTSCLTSLESAV